MSSIKFSQHAKQRMIERGITEEQVEDTLNPPTILSQGYGKKTVATKNGIRVIFIQSDNEIIIVTVTLE